MFSPVGNISNPIFAQHKRDGFYAMPVFPFHRSRIPQFGEDAFVVEALRDKQALLAL